MGPETALSRKRLLIEEWLPIAEIGEESMRERRSMTALPPNYYLHVWWARRPLVASRAAVLASLLPANADRRQFLNTLGIHGDPVAAKAAIVDAKKTGERLAETYGYKRAFTHTPDNAGLPRVTVLDPTAGGGSIPFEAVRLGQRVIANDLNPVAWLVMKATVELPLRFGPALLKRYNELAKRFVELATPRFRGIFPQEPDGVIGVDGYLWARTVKCMYCGCIVPLSPNWALTSKGDGVRLLPLEERGRRFCQFEVVKRLQEQSEGTVAGGDAKCPFPGCNSTIDGDEIKRQAQASQMGQQLYAVVYKYDKVVGRTKAGKAKLKRERGFRAPRSEDDVEKLVARRLVEKMPDWEVRGIVPDERYPEDANELRPLQYGMPLWRDMFSQRQLFGHCTSVEIFQELTEAAVTDLDRAALTYVALALDKMLNYNAYQVRWHSKREVVAGVFDRHDFSFKWSYAEMAPTITGFGYDWACKQTGKALKELVELLGHTAQTTIQDGSREGCVDVTCGSADTLDLKTASIDSIVMDPPYYDNVMYAELSDFFYVWLKRTAGLLYPEVFNLQLTDKDREAVANPAKFKGQKGGVKKLAGQDYQRRMADIFRECRRVLKKDGVMTVMFTHKASGAWDALARSLVDAGFVITASWPINTESEGSLHIKEKSAAKSTIFLVCRPREGTTGEAAYWEDVEPLVRDAVRRRVADYQASGIKGIDLYLSCFGPALQVFSESWPLKRGNAKPEAKRGPKQKNLLVEDDPYAVTPEDALDAARSAVKAWRIGQLARMNRQRELDPLTEWFVLAWDAFGAPRFPADEGLKLARVAGVDFDVAIKNVVCGLKGDDITLWDSTEREKRSKIGAADGECLLNVLHRAAVLVRTQNVGVAKAQLEAWGLLDSPALKMGLEAMLNVLPPSSSGDFAALEKLRRFAYREQVPEPEAAKNMEFDF